jgi:hypothetical protein
MWIIPLLLIGAFVVAAASKSPREIVQGPVSRQLPPPPPKTPELPGPISVLGEILRIGQVPSPTVILCAIAEAESCGRSDIAADIVRTFVAPVVYQQQLANAHPAYQRGSCALPNDPRAQADYQRGSGASRAPSPSPVASSPFVPSSSSPSPSPSPFVPPPPTPTPEPTPAAATPQLTSRPATEDEILALLHTDPQAFFAITSSGRRPMIEVPIAAPRPAAAPATAPSSMPMPSPIMPQPMVVTPSSVQVDALAEQLLRLPGHAGAGIVRVSPAEGDEIFEVRWLRGYQIPALPQMIDGRPLRLAIVDSLPVAQPIGLPPEAGVQRQDDAGEREAADLTQANAINSPVPGVPDDAWREFTRRLEREDLTFDSNRHVGRYRQRRERLAELGIDPRAIHGSATAQRCALDTDLSNALVHAVAGGMLGQLGHPIAVPGRDGSETITLSGVLGVIQCAGLDGAVSWLESPNDRRRYPHTTQAFVRCNGVF